MSRINLALIYGSAREGRLCDTVAAWAAQQIRAFGTFRVEHIDPQALDVASLDPKNVPGVPALRSQIDAADAFVVVTPEYNHGYPAALKFLVDCAYAEWHAKPVSFVSYGGISGGLRAIEQLRLVFAELRAVTIRDTVSFVNASDNVGDDGPLIASTEAVIAMRVMLTDLLWWATVLKDARKPPEDAVG